VTVVFAVDDHLTILKAAVDIVEPIFALGIKSRTQFEIKVAENRIAVTVVACELVQADLVFGMDAAEESEQSAEKE
jgi:hypothetical protein